MLGKVIVSENEIILREESGDIVFKSIKEYKEYLKKYMDKELYPMLENVIKKLNRITTKNHLQEVIDEVIDYREKIDMFDEMLEDFKEVLGDV